MLKDIQEIKEVVMRYVDGLKTGDIELLKSAFSKYATMTGYNAQGLAEGSVDALFEAMKVVGGDAKGVAEIDVIGLYGTAAVAKVTMEDWHGGKFVDFHSLVKIDGKWIIVAKIFAE